ncbi:MAG TPA: flagellar assembly peptidoglycan hydrolase FlgJ [Novimethylophilus sp.]|jgi:flagellar protein FlgJ|uniref:flagellar assembly peptidoglycan hydrolase FlgJ n=1 Tax=Novimethylophilus sp. TaxID=2137426 RepID=UPI002F404FC0
MALAAPISNQLASNPQALDGLRKLANSADSTEGIKAAAKQFESYFLQMMLRSMRETVSQDGLFDSQETRSFTEMLDQQVSQNISQSRGFGLADMLVTQIERQLPQANGKTAIVKPVSYDLAPVGTEARLPQAKEAPAATPSAGGFVDKLWPHAAEAAQSLGVAPHLLLGQAALESGWGKHELKGADGSNSHNLFNIKAGSNWKGATVEKQVTEYVNGKPVQTAEKFRAYGSYAEGFADYARLLTSNPRYSGVLNRDAEGFAQGLVQGGFATDPGYADRLLRVINSQAMRSQLAAAETA